MKLVARLLFLGYRQIERFLCSYCHNLTISGRAVYSDQKSEATTIEKFHTINELFHRVSSQLMHLASGDGAAEPDDVFFNPYILSPAKVTAKSNSALLLSTHCSSASSSPNGTGC
jgi:hypothetical protein